MALTSRSILRSTLMLPSKGDCYSTHDKVAYDQKTVGCYDYSHYAASANSIAVWSASRFRN